MEDYLTSSPMPHFRSRTGCLTCRRRKKKCDERRPRCAGCVRNHLSCSWVPHPHDSPVPEAVEVQSTPGRDDIDPIDDKTFVRWSTRSISFLARERACLTLSISPALLQHYICETGLLLPAAIGKCNPFIAYVVPLAYADDLLMHAVLCLSATHLSCKQGRTFEIERAISVHYSAVLKNIRNEIGDLEVAECHKLVRLLVILVFIAHYEAASGDVSGSMFTHLRASHQLISHLYDQQHTQVLADRKLLAFATELYAYTVCVNTLTPLGLIPARTITYDDSFPVSNELVKHETFGVMFTGLHELYGLIPKISHLGSVRLEEERLLITSARSQATYQILYNEIESFRLEIEPPADQAEESEEMQKALAAEMYQHGLHIYLTSSMAGSVMNDEKLRDQVQERASSIMEIAKLVQNSLISSSLLWPIFIAGSCLVDRQQQVDFVTRLSSTRYKMYHLLQGCELLQLLWRDDDPRCFGPYGLYLAMRKHNLNLCLF